MARIEQIILTDDIDGEPAEETISFGLDGVTYEIDLSAHNAQVLRETFAEYITHARKLGKVQTGVPQAPKKASKGSGLSKEESMAIRNWANTQGLQISERGRIPREIVEKYQEAIAA